MSCPVHVLQWHVVIASYAIAGSYPRVDWECRGGNGLDSQGLVSDVYTHHVLAHCTGGSNYWGMLVGSMPGGCRVSGQKTTKDGEPVGRAFASAKNGSCRSFRGTVF